MYLITFINYIIFFFGREINISTMDYEEAEKLMNITIEEAVKAPGSDIPIRFIIFTIIVIISLCVDVIIVYTILSYKKLRTVPNIFFVNWIIADFFSLICSPSNFEILLLFNTVSLPDDLFYILLLVTNTGNVVIILFAIMLALDYFLNAYYESTSTDFRNYYKFIVASVWGISFLVCVILIALYLSGSFVYTLHMYALVLTYGGLLIGIVTMQLLRFIDRFKNRMLGCSTYTLTLTTALVSCWFLPYCNFILLGFSNTFVPALEIISVCLVYGTSIVIIVLLYNLNKDFQACFLQILRRSRIRYQESSLEFHNPMRKPIVKTPTQISFTKEQDFLSSIYVS